MVWSSQGLHSINLQVNAKDLPINENNFPFGEPPLKVSLYQQLYRSKPSKDNKLELFIDNIEKELFNPYYIRKTRNNLKKEEKLALNEMKFLEDKVTRVQDKGSRFVVFVFLICSPKLQ